MTSSDPSVSDWSAVDFIVIGAGPAGCAIAARLPLSSSATSVALIEAGPARASLLSDVPLGIAALVPRRSRRNYAYETAPQPGLGGRRGYQPRGRGLGGSSLINAMIYTPGQPQDYDAWAALGCKGWSWSDVLPYFKRSEDNSRGADAWHGVGGALRVSDLSYANPAVEAFVKAALQAGYKRNTDFNGETQEGVGPIRCCRGTADDTTPRGPIFNCRPPLIYKCSPTVRRGASCLRDGAPSVLPMAQVAPSGGFTRAGKSSSAAAPSDRRNF